MTATLALHLRAPSRIVRESSSFAAIWPQRPFATPNWVSSICLYLLVTDCFAAGCSRAQPHAFLAARAARDLSMSSTSSRQYRCKSFLGRRGLDCRRGLFLRDISVFSSALLCALLTRYAPQIYNGLCYRSPIRGCAEKFLRLRVASILSDRHHRTLMARDRSLPPVITKLKAWRSLNKLSQSQAVQRLVAAGLPIKLRTLQTWEIGQASPQPVTAAALERFLTGDRKSTMSQKTPAPIILRLKAWREANNLSQAEAVGALVSAGVPAKLPTLQQWETGRRSPPAITTAALERFLHEDPSFDRRTSGH